MCLAPAPACADVADDLQPVHGISMGWLVGLPGSRELGVEVVQEGPPDVDDEPRLGFPEEGGVGMSDARLIADREQRIEDAGAGVEDGLDVLGSWTEVGELGMTSLQLPEEGDHRLTLPV